MRQFEKLGIKIHGATAGHIKTFCPFCHKDRHDQRDKSLSVDIDNGLYKCHYCGAAGYVPDKDEEKRNEERRLKREQKQNTPPKQGNHIRPQWNPQFLIKPIDLIDPSSKSEHSEQHPKPTAGDESPQGSMLPVPSNPIPGFLERQRVIDYLTTLRGLSLETLFQMRVTAQWKEPRPGSVGNLQCVIGFNYFDHDILINTKTRTLDKHFEFVAKAELIPYNIDSILRKDICYITEGEFDCITMVQCGFPETISVPNGAQKNLNFLDRFIETHFDDKNKIVLALDNDPKGVMLKNELLRRLGEERCRLVQWSDDCKDANDELLKHGATSVQKCVNSAAEIPLTGIQTVEDVEASLDELFVNGKQHGAEMHLGEFDKVITFETGRYMVVTGRPGDGKSEFVDEICLRLCLLHGWKTAYFSPENTPITYHLSKLIEKLSGFQFQQSGKMTWNLYNGCKRWLSDNVCHILPGTDVDPTVDEFNADYQNALENNTDRYTLPAILEKARQAISRRGVRILVIDPLNNIEPEPGLEDLRWDRKVNSELRRFARKYHCLVILVAHPRKVNRANLDGRKRRVEMNDINGSADFGNMSDFCISVDRDDEMGIVSVFVDKVKFKHLGSRGVYYFHYDNLSGRYVPCEVDRVPQGVEIELGKVEGKKDTFCVKNSAGAKFFKTIDWSYFNIRWVTDSGDARLEQVLTTGLNQPATLQFN